MGMFDFMNSQNYQNATGQKPTGLTDWAFANYDAAANGNPNFTPDSTPISMPSLQTNAYKNAQVRTPSASPVDELAAVMRGENSDGGWKNARPGSLAGATSSSVFPDGGWYSDRAKPSVIGSPREQMDGDFGGMGDNVPYPTTPKAAKVLKKATAPAKTKKQKAKRGAARAAVTKAENKAVAQAGRKQPGVHEALMGLNAGAFGAGGPRGAYGYNNDDIMSMF